jgi:hypothetical protein
MNALIFVAIVSMVCENTGSIHPIIGVSGQKGVFKCVASDERIIRPEKFAELRQYYYFKCSTHSNAGSEYRAVDCDMSGVREGCSIDLTDGRRLTSAKPCRKLIGAK